MLAPAYTNIGAPALTPLRRHDLPSIHDVLHAARGLHLPLPRAHGGVFGAMEWGTTKEGMEVVLVDGERKVEARFLQVIGETNTMYVDGLSVQVACFIHRSVRRGADEDSENRGGRVRHHASALRDGFVGASHGQRRTVLGGDRGDARGPFGRGCLDNYFRGCPGSTTSTRHGAPIVEHFMLLLLDY